MNHPLTLLALALLAACSTPESSSAPAVPVAGANSLPTLAGARAFHRLDLPNLADNVRDDTLLIHTTYALGNGEFVMAAMNQAGSREGLRLILYRPRPDSSAEVLATSKPAYDSEVMLPTCFSSGDTADGLVLLANYGARDSWGQNVFLLKNHRFTDLGWLDVAGRTWEHGPDGLQQRRLNLAPMTGVSGGGGQFEFTFNTDSVLLYDDLAGSTEVMFPASRIRYRYNGSKMQLLVDGQVRQRQEPL